MPPRLIKLMSRFAVLALVLTLPAFADVCGSIAGNLVQNCGFETGNFTDWAQAGNLGFTFVTSNSTYVHSGTYGAQLGPIGSDGFLIQQVLNTVPGTISLFYYLENEGNPPDDFTAYWNGVPINVFINAFPLNPWQLQGSLSLVATGNDTLTFGFRQDPSYWGLDDISVVQTSTTPDGGVTLMLLGGALAALETLRRRLRA